MEKIEAGKYVELVYEIFVVNGEKQVKVFNCDKEHPDAFVFGLDPALIEGFQRNIMGLEQGEQFDFELAPRDAFGEVDNDRVVELEKEIFYRDGKFDNENIFPGAIITMRTEDGMPLNGQVIKIADDVVIMDFNHPYAGRPVHISGHVQLVRDATPEELQPKHHHCGCGCEECGGGDCGHDHGDGCDCGCGGC